MPFCPDCTYEYTPGVQVCPDCGAPLVDRLPDPPDPDVPGPTLVPLPSLPGRVYADMLKEVLNNRSIPCLIQGDWPPRGYAPSGTSAESVVVLVPADRHAECTALQQEMFGDL